MTKILIALGLSISTNAYAVDVGVNVHLPASSLEQEVPALDRAVEMKLSWGRIDLRWDFVEGHPMNDVASEGTWQVIDASIYALRSRGMKVLAILQGTPAWASTNGQDTGTFSEAGKEHYKRFVRAVAERYRDYVWHYEIFNEPNLKAFYVGTVDDYVDQMVIPGREILKSVSNDIFVTGPSLSNLMKSDIKVETFLQRLGERQRQYGQRFFDIITHHTYNDNASGVISEFTQGRKSCVWVFCVKQRDPIMKIYEKNGFTTEPLWLTEFGWTSNRTPAEQETQAQKIVQTVNRLGEIPRLTNAFIYHIQDDPRMDSDHGLLFSDGTPKKVYEYLRDR